MLDQDLYTPSRLDVHASACGTVRTVTVTGELDLAVSDDFAASARRAIADEPEMVVIDLSGLDFIDSTGIHEMLQVHRHAEARGVRLVIVPGSDHVQMVFRVCGVADALPFVPVAAA